MVQLVLGFLELSSESGDCLLCNQLVIVDLVEPGIDVREFGVVLLLLGEQLVLDPLHFLLRAELGLPLVLLRLLQLLVQLVRHPKIVVSSQLLLL